MSLATVRTHIRNAKRKTGARTLRDLARSPRAQTGRHLTKMSDDGRSLPAIRGERASPVTASPVGRDLVRCGAGSSSSPSASTAASSWAACASSAWPASPRSRFCRCDTRMPATPLRQWSRRPFWPRRPHRRPSRRRAVPAAAAAYGGTAGPGAARHGPRHVPAAQRAVVALGALVMLVATLVPLRVTLAYCLVVLLANLIAHLVWGDLATLLRRTSSASGSGMCAGRPRSPCSQSASPPT